MTEERHRAGEPRGVRRTGPAVIALFGSLAGQAGAFMTGLHASLLISAGVLQVTCEAASAPALDVIAWFPGGFFALPRCFQREYYLESVCSKYLFTIRAAKGGAVTSYAPGL